MATENAVGALGKILEFHPNLADPSLGTVFVQNLPLVEDEEEARIVHPQLVRLVSANDSRILGQGNSNLPKIMEVLIRVVGSGEKLVQANDVPEMATLINQLRGAFPDHFESCVGALKPKQQEALMKALGS
jgi:hypothetical protein